MCDVNKCITTSVYSLYALPNIVGSLLGIACLQGFPDMVTFWLLFKGATYVLLHIRATTSTRYRLTDRPLLYSAVRIPTLTYIIKDLIKISELIVGFTRLNSNTA